MKISVMTFPFHNLFAADDKNIADFLQKIQAAGATGIETMFGWETKAPASWKYLCDTAKSLGIHQACYDIGINLIYSNQEEYSDISARAKTQIAFCRETLDCGVAMFYNSKPAEGMPYPEGRKIFGEMMNELSEYAASFNVKICTEDFDPRPDFVCSADTCLEALSYAPKAGLAFDTGNFLIADDNPKDIYPRVKDRIFHVHVKEKKEVAPDAVEKPQKSLAGKCYVAAPFGEGNANIADCVAFLKADGYTGWLSVESFLGPDDAIRGTAFLAKCAAL